MADKKKIVKLKSISSILIKLLLLLIIPQNICEMCLAVKPEETSKLYLGDDKRQSRSKQFIIQGAKFKYNTRGTETLTSRGPLLANIEIQVTTLLHPVLKFLSK